VLQGFLRDCAQPHSQLPLDKSQPLYIIELGTGSGKFSYYMLKALVELKDVLDFPIDKIVYVMTDFTENNFKFWMNHPQLQPFFERGILDAAIFDAVNDSSIRLVKSGRVLSPASTVNPLCIVANYLFDTLCHDIFQVKPPGILTEGLVSVGSRRAEEPDPLDPEIIKRLDNHYRYDEIGDDYYANEGDDGLHFRRLLAW
jgi:SAM-dependent MidA family methyltransferase